MANVKVTTIFLIGLLLYSTLTYAARPEPSSPSGQNKVVEAEHAEEEMGCEGISEEECLERRTLAAHTDYIYTQKHKP